MEKRIDPNDTALHTASTDPAFIPGITPAAPSEPKKPMKSTKSPKSPEPDASTDAAESAEAPEEAEAADATAASEVTEADTEGAADTPSDPDADTDAKADADTETDADTDEDDAPEAEPGAKDGGDAPSFEAADRRGAIEMDGSGVRFRLDDQEAEFTWDEIGAVEHTAARFGRRLTVTVHTTAKRSYPAEVEATGRRELKEWTAALDAVLDAHFED